MNQLLIPIAAVGDEGFLVNLRVKTAEVQPPNTPGIPLEMVHVQGLVLAVDNDYLFQGRLEGVYERPCDRCLAPAGVPWESKVVWLFEQEPGGGFSLKTPDFDDDEMDAVLAQRPPTRVGTLDLGPCVWEEAVLNTPLKFVCKPDCRGLCPRCGANLNNRPCSCGSGEPLNEAPVTGLAELARLFPDLAPKKSEE